MSEKELEEVAAFFASPTGKKYSQSSRHSSIASKTCSDLGANSLSTDIVVKAREEMKKKGVDF